MQAQRINSPTHSIFIFYNFHRMDSKPPTEYDHTIAIVSQLLAVVAVSTICVHGTFRVYLRADLHRHNAA